MKLPGELAPSAPAATESKIKTETKTETTPAASESKTETAPAASEAKTETAPASSETKTETAPASTTSDNTLSAANPGATSTTPEDAATTSDTVAKNGTDGSSSQASPGAKVESGGSSSKSTSTANAPAAKAPAAPADWPTTKPATPAQKEYSKAEKNEIETAIIVGASVPQPSNVTVPSFRTSHLTDDAATKPLSASTPCASDPKKVDTPDLNTSDAGDVLPYPNRVIDEEKVRKEAIAAEKLPKKKPLRPAKYPSNFEKPSFGAPE